MKLKGSTKKYQEPILDFESRGILDTLAITLRALVLTSLIPLQELIE